MTAQIRLKGAKIGDDMGLVSVTVAGASDGTMVSSFRKPAIITALPRLSDAFDGDTMTVDTTGLSGVSTYDFREIGGASLQNGAGETFDTTGYGGKIIEVQVTADPANTVYTSPPIMVNSTSMMGMGMHMAHMRDDRAILAILPHDALTHIAVNDGDWTDPATWLNDLVPRNGGAVLIPHGRTVTYDVSEENIRLDRVRIDGRLDFARDQDTRMLVETVTVTRDGTLTIGESSTTRLPSQYSCEIIISGKFYRSGSYTPTDMNAATIAARRAWERGIVSLGTWRMWGAKKTTWGWATEQLYAGDTSLTFDRDMEGLAIGDTIIIGSSNFTYAHSDLESRAFELETEEREITGVSGRTVLWTDPLDYDHGNPCTGSTREDITSPILVKGNNNITIRSEVTDPDFWWQRGHTACMHHFAVVDFWDVNFIGLGRTNKQVFWDGNLKSDNMVDTFVSGVRDQIPLTPQSNIQSRYPVHLHLVGFDHEEDERPIITGCYIEGSPGWGIVHHDCDADFFNNGVYKFFGAGMVSEQGSELGAWNNNLVMHTTWIGSSNQNSQPKTLEGAKGNIGLGGRHGYGYFYRGRAVRGNGNVACGVTHGHVFYARVSSNASSVIVDTKDPPRSAIDIKEAGVIRNGELGITEGVFNHVDYPILHMADNVSIACITGHFVTKLRVDQDHDVNVKIKRPRSYGVSGSGFIAEYVGTYIVDRPDTVGHKNDRASGNGTGAQSMQVMIINPRAEMPVDRGASVNFGMKSTSDRSDLFDNVEDPRYGLIGNDDPNDGGIGFGGNSGNDKEPLEVTFVDADWDDTFIDYDQDPSDNIPLVVGEIPGSGISVVNIPDNESYFKTDNLSNKGRILEKRGKDYVWPTDRNDVQMFRNEYGYWEYDLGEGGGVEYFVRLPYIISDRLTGRPFKGVKLIRLANGDISGTNNGALTLAATPVSLTDANLTYPVVTNGSVTFNILTNAGPSGASGAGTYSIDAGDFIAPDYGRIVKDNVTGAITYTPDPDRVGPDECYFFIYSGSRYGTVRVNFLVNDAGTAPTPATPTSPTNFEVSDHADANTIGVYLKTPPDTSQRRIDLVEYSTDGGSTWRRLCHGWVRDTHRIKHLSPSSDNHNLTATVPTGAQSVLIRYKTDYDYVRSTASAAQAVTVS